MELNLKKHKNDLLFLPLGGANEIGMNVNLYHLDGKWIMIDLGVGFANDVPGIDMLTPDISFIKAQKKNLIAIVLTHIHEDHLGAVQHLIQELDVPIYASNLAAHFLRSKLSEFKLDRRVDIRLIEGEEHLQLGPFDIEFIGLTHSVPEMKALYIRTSKGNILHTGDWKFDPDPVVGDISEKEKIKKLGDSGEVLAVICDSTNVLSEGHSRSEGELYESLKELIAGRKGYVGVTTFASNIARVHTIAKIAKDVGRKVVLAGWSLHRISEVARKSGYFTEGFADESNFISDRELKFYKKSEVLILSTGCQGEQNAATNKIANDKHPTIKFTKGDLMIFSSKIIPGNEKKIFALFDCLAKKQIDVMTEKDHFVHVSGHPSQDELKEMYALARPKIAIPVHGEFIHTKTHGDLARNCGVQKIVQIENGMAVKISNENFMEETKAVGFVQSGYFGVDGHQLLNLDGEIIRQRRKLKDGGIVMISISVDAAFRLSSDIKIICVGSYDLQNDFETEDFILDEIEAILKAKSRESGSGKNSGFKFLQKKKHKVNDKKLLAGLEKTIRTRTLKILEQVMGKRPALEVVIHVND